MRRPKHKQTFEEFEKVIQDKKLIIWGRGTNCQEVCAKYDVAYIIDQNDELCDGILDKVRTYLPEKLYSEKVSDVVILICTANKWYREIMIKLNEIDDFEVFFYNTIKSSFLSAFSVELYENINRIEWVKSRLYDDYSKKVYQEVVNRRMCGSMFGYDDLKVNNEIQYLFAPAIYSKTHGTILDVGGYIGDSVERFVSKMGNEIEKIITFEAFENHVSVIKRKKKELEQFFEGTIEIIPYAVADKEGVLEFFGSCAELPNGAFYYSPQFVCEERNAEIKNPEIFKVNCTTIDNIVSAAEEVRYMEMDIEGAEYAALIGAEKTIKRCKPGLAISIYHNASDYYRLAELILKYVPEYKLAIRHHRARHWDTVLYAWL